MPSFAGVEIFSFFFKPVVVGVGKSAFAVPLIAFLAHNKRPVLYRHKAGQRETLLLMDFSKEPFECRMAAYSSGTQDLWQVSGNVCLHQQARPVAGYCWRE